MAIAFETSASNDATSTDDVTVTISPTDDHAVLGFYATNDNTSLPVTLDAGSFTNIDAQEDATGSDNTTSLDQKIAASEGSSYAYAGDETGVNQTSALFATFSGVHADVLDVTYVRASHYDKQQDDTTPTPQPITTNTDGALVLVFVLVSGTTATAFGALSGYTLRESLIGNNRNIALYSKSVATAGTETPGAITVTGIAATDDTSMYTIALKPAAASSAGVMAVLRRRL